MESCFQLKIPYDQRCIFAGLYRVTQAPACVAVSVHNKMDRESNMERLVAFVTRVRDQNLNAAVIKTPA